MFRGEKVLAVIPARGGSQRIPKKNIQLLGGKPLIVWTLEAASGSMFIDESVVSTDDEEIRTIVEEHGIKNVLARPEHLATNESKTSDVLLYVIEQIQARGASFGYLLLLQPTSPLRQSRHIDESFQLLERKGGEGLVSICPTDQPKEWMGQITEDGFMDTFFAETDLTLRSQDMPQRFQINGAIYIASLENFRLEETFFLETGVVGYIMDRLSSIDIDEVVDMEIASQILSVEQR